MLRLECSHRFLTRHPALSRANREGDVPTRKSSKLVIERSASADYDLMLPDTDCGNFPTNLDREDAVFRGRKVVMLRQNSIQTALPSISFLGLATREAGDACRNSISIFKTLHVL